MFHRGQPVDEEMYARFLEHLSRTLGTEITYLCPHCRRQIEKSEKLLTVHSPYTGLNQLSRRFWRGIKVSILQWKILNHLSMQKPNHVSQKDLVNFLWSYDPTINRVHNLRQDIYLLRRLLKNSGDKWRIERDQQGYYLVEHEFEGVLIV